MISVQRWTILVILAGHFTAAFAALGMPPFFVMILEQSLHSDSIYLAGWLYGIPILFTALSSPIWGYLADRVGKKAMLLRAQIGLAASFLLAGFADTTAQFVVALILQGVLGGTFGASNAYLASIMRGRTLTRSLTLMQGSARAALISAPIVLGLFIELTSPIELYRYLAILPLMSALLIWRMPSQPVVTKALEVKGRHNCLRPAFSATQIYFIQFIFVFATVITFPYFIAFAQQETFSLSASFAGFLFGLPHLVYLLFARLLSRWFGEHHMHATLSFALALLAITLIGQAHVSSVSELVGWRVLMGMAMTLVFIILHGSISAVIDASHAGKIMGWFESSSKWGGVFAAVAAGLVVQAVGLAAPFMVGAVCVLLTLCFLFVISLSLRRESAAEG